MPFYQRCKRPCRLETDAATPVAIGLGSGPLKATLHPFPGALYPRVGRAAGLRHVPRLHVLLVEYCL